MHISQGRAKIWTAYAVAIVGTVLMLLVRLWLSPWAGGHAALSLFMLPVALAAALGGLKPGILATLFGAGLGVYYVMEPRGSFDIHTSDNAVVLVIHVLTALFISVVCDNQIMQARAKERAEAGRTEYEARFSDIISKVNDGIYMVDKEFRLLMGNRAFLKLLNRPASEVLGKIAWEVFTIQPGSDLREKMEAALANGEPTQIETPDRHGRWFQLRLFPDKETGSMTIFVHNITDQKLLQQAQAVLLDDERAKRSDAEHESRMKDEFVATLSHELRTPLTAIVGWADLLRTKTEDGTEVADGLDAISRAARVQAEMVEDLLDISRIVTGQLKMRLEVVDLAEIVQEVVATHEAAAKQKGKNFRVELPEEPVFVKADSLRLSQVVSNLVTNAVKFTEEGDDITVSLTSDSEVAVLVVKDTGHGIDPAVLPFIFDRFRQGNASITRRHGGLGLGLAIVQQLVEAHRGKVTAESDGIGRGTRMKVVLPVVLGRPRFADEPDRPNAHSLLGVRAMLVDDDETTRTILSKILTAQGVEVDSCESARVALMRIEDFKPDVVISDVGMPGMDGYQFVSQLRMLPERSIAEVPTLALTAFARADDRDRAIGAGFDMHLSKPITSERLITALQRLVGGRP